MLGFFITLFLDKNIHFNDNFIVYWRKIMELKQKIKKIWNYFTTYEKSWVISIVVLSIIITILFPSMVDGLGVSPIIIKIGRASCRERVSS